MTWVLLIYFIAKLQIILRLLRNLFKALKVKYKKKNTSKIQSYLYLLVFSLLILILISSIVIIPLKEYSPPLVEIEIYKYDLVITPKSSKLTRFKIEESLLVREIIGNENIGSKQSLASNEKEVTPINIGLLVQELYIKPFGVDYHGFVSVYLNNRELHEGILCELSCPPSTVKLIDFPQGSLYSIKNEKGFSVEDKYLDKETVKWSVYNIEKGIKLAYIKPPFHHLIKVINPFLKLANSNNFFIAFLGGSLAIFFKKVTPPIINIKNIATAKHNSSLNNLNYNQADHIHQKGSFGVGVNKGEVKAEKVIGTINEAQKQQIIEVVAEIQRLLEQLEESYPTDTATGKLALATETITQIENNSNLKARIISVLEANGIKAFEQSLNHPAANFLIFLLRDWC